MVIGALAGGGREAAVREVEEGRQVPLRRAAQLPAGLCGKDGEAAPSPASSRPASSPPNADATAAACSARSARAWSWSPPRRARTPRQAADLQGRQAPHEAGAAPARAAPPTSSAQLGEGGRPPDVGDARRQEAARLRQHRRLRGGPGRGRHGARPKKPPSGWRRTPRTGPKQSGPAAYAQLIFAAHAAGADPRDFGGTDLVAALNATGPAPPAAGRRAPKETRRKDDGGVSVWWIIGVGLVAGAGIGFLLSSRNKKNQL